MAKKTKCARVASNVCPSGIAAAAISLEKTCEGKQAAVTRLMAELQKDVKRGRVTPAAAQQIVMSKVRGVDGTCRLQKVRMKRMDELAREAARKLEADRERIVGGQAMDGLFGLGIFGL